MKTASLHKQHASKTCLQLMDVLLLASNVALQIKLEWDVVLINMDVPLVLIWHFAYQQQFFLDNQSFPYSAKNECSISWRYVYIMILVKPVGFT